MVFKNKEGGGGRNDFSTPEVGKGKFCLVLAVPGQQQGRKSPL